MDLLSMIKVQQNFPDDCILDVPAAVERELQASKVEIPAGASIAIAVGSRGIANIALIVKTVCNFLRARGAYPFVIPAMGSHGGATAGGQRQVLEGYGITEEYIEAPIRAGMDVVELDSHGLKNRVFMDRFAYQADAIFLINRIKAHTDFHGEIESGLVKMCVIGLGKHAQALELHQFGVEGLRQLIPLTAKRVLDTGKVILGLGIIENAHDHTALIRALRPAKFFTEEPQLLKLSKSLMPSLPADDIDILIVDFIGKDLCGCGLDTNIIGRMRIAGEKEPSSPRIKNIVVDDLSPAAHGNAIGIGLSDFTTRKLVEKSTSPLCMKTYSPAAL